LAESATKTLRNMIEWLRQRPPFLRILVYVVAVAVVFAIAAGAGAMGALLLQGDLGLPGRGEPRPSAEQADTPQHQRADAERSRQEKAADQQEEAAVQQKVTAPPLTEADYVSKVGDIQAKAVETFLDGHDRLVPYDALTTDDVEKVRANQAALQGFTNQVADLDPPQKYGEHYEVFSSATNELYESARLAYTLAADPTAATQAEFDEYDRHVNEAAALLQRSNEILGRGYMTIRGVQEINPLS
jgi:hypothetical protein